MAKIYFDAGHGGSDPGAVKYVKEADVAMKVVEYAVAYMKEMCIRDSMPSCLAIRMES